MLEKYFKTENYEKADKLIKKYNREHSIEFSFGAVVIAFLKDNILLADKLLQKAINTNKYFVSEASKNRHIKPPPHRIPGEPFFDTGIPIGSIQQAFDYWFGIGSYIAIKR